MSLFWKQNRRHITSLMPNRRVIISKRPYISLIIVSLASKYENYLQEIMACESFVEHLVGFFIHLTTEVVPEIFPNLNVVGHLAVPVGWGSCLLRLPNLNVVGHLAVPAGWGSCLPRLATFNHDQNE